jgi:hypothetical protein
MPGITSYEADLLLARAIVEVLEGKPGAGVAHAKNMITLADAGMSADPNALPHAQPEQRRPSMGDVITTETLIRREQGARRPR